RPRGSAAGGRRSGASRRTAPRSPAPTTCRRSAPGTAGTGSWRRTRRAGPGSVGCVPLVTLRELGSRRRPVTRGYLYHARVPSCGGKCWRIVGERSAGRASVRRGGFPPMRYLLLLAAVPQLALAAAVIRIDESRSLSIAVAFRSSMGGTNIPAQDGSSRALDLSVDGAVLAIGGELDKHLRLQINALRVPTTGAITVADAIVQVDVAPWLQVWAGRMLPPLDRASLTGPFFGVLYDPPVASAYPALLPGGRDDGVALWGTFLEGRLKYEAGGFRGRVGAPNLLAFPMFAARVSYSFWDPEP